MLIKRSHVTLLGGEIILVLSQMVIWVTLLLHIRYNFQCDITNSCQILQDQMQICIAYYARAFGPSPHRPPATGLWTAAVFVECGAIIFIYEYNLIEIVKWSDVYLISWIVFKNMFYYYNTYMINFTIIFTWIRFYLCYPPTSVSISQNYCWMIFRETAEIIPLSINVCLQ